MVGYIDGHRDEFGVEPICAALRMAPSTYYAAKRRQPSPRAVRDIVMMQMLVLWVANRKVYGAHKLRKAARRAGHDIGRDQVARLMRELDIRGVSRCRKVFTTRPDPDALRAPDLVNRNFTADRPDALWVTDLTYVPTRSGMAYVCFIVDAFSRRIVGWRVAANMKTAMVLDALEMARRSRGNARLIGLVAHSDAGSQTRFSSRRCGSPNVSTRSAPDPASAPSPTACYAGDNAAMETFWATLKREIAHIRGPLGIWFETRAAAHAYLFSSSRSSTIGNAIKPASTTSRQPSTPPDTDMTHNPCPGFGVNSTTPTARPVSR